MAILKILVDRTFIFGMDVPRDITFDLYMYHDMNLTFSPVKGHSL